MISFRSALRLMTAMQRRKKHDETHPGTAAAAYGFDLLAAVEGLVSEGMGGASSFPASAAVRQFLDHARRGERDAFGHLPSPLPSTDPRGSVAQALGLAAAGGRASVCLSGPDFLAAQDLVTQAVGRNLPLVLHLGLRATARHGTAVGGGHQALFAAAETGAPVLVATTVQEALDLTLAARRLAEDLLTPVVVAVDPETLTSVQDVHVPDLDTVRRYLGLPEDKIHPSTPAQALTFGRHRRRVPRRFDPGRPSLLGPGLDGSGYGLGVAARHAYVDVHTRDRLRDALDAWKRETGRPTEVVTKATSRNARVILIALGQAVETAEGVAAVLSKERAPVSVIGIRAIHPFPYAELAEQLRGAEVAVVLERVPPRAGGASPLLREVSAVLERARRREGREASFPRLSDTEVPRLVAVHYGLGGDPLRSGDLSGLLRSIRGDARSTILLGVDFGTPDPAFPKQQVLLDALRRDYPDAADSGFRSDEPEPARGVLDPAAVAMEIRSPGAESERLTGRTAALLHELVSPCHIRTRSRLGWERWGEPSPHRLVYSPEPVRDPGDDVSVDVLALFGAPSIRSRTPGSVAHGGAVLVTRNPEAGPVWSVLPPALQRTIQTGQVSLYAVDEVRGATHREERHLGALIGVLRAEKKLDVNERQALRARKMVLDDLEKTELDRRMSSFQEGLDGVRRVDTSGLEASAETREPERPVPEALHRLRLSEDTLDNPAGFHDRTGILYERGRTDRLAPEPHLAAGTLPPLSSAFTDASRFRTRFPVFHPERCTGCGACWSLCPDGAVGAVVIGASKLVDHGMQQAKRSGANADALRMAVSKIAAGIDEAAAGAAGPGIRAGELLDAAFPRVLESMRLTPEKKANLEDAYRSVRNEIGDLCLVRTAPFFEEPAKGKKELFTLAVNPDACKGCGVCVSACEPEALIVEPEPAGDAAIAAREQWMAVDALPETQAGTIAVARAHAEVGPLAAALLARRKSAVLAPGDGAEPGSGARIAVRQVLETAAFLRAPVITAQVEDLESLKESLGEAVKSRLAGALPTGDLDALSQGLQGIDSPDVDLGDLSSRVEAAFAAERVDADDLRRLVDTARQVNDLHWCLTVGESGAGRAPFGLVVSGGAESAWMAAFPRNPFGVPVVTAGADAGDTARGVWEGMLRGLLEEFRLLRQARLELERPKEAAHARETLAALSWNDLTPEERRTVPPLLIVGTEADLAGPGLASLGTLFGTDLPVKVLSLCGTEMGMGSATGPVTPAETLSSYHGDLGVFALAHPRVFAAQTSIAHGSHLAGSTAKALEFSGPALVRVHAPSPERDAFPADRTPQRAEEAVRCRVMPLYRTILDKDGSTVSLSIDGNPDPESPWVLDEDGRPVTPATWALAEGRFAAELTPLDHEAGDPVPVSEYLELDAEDRAGKTPVIESPEGPRRVSDAFVRRVRDHRTAWRRLQKLARPEPAGLPATAPAPEAPLDPSPNVDAEIAALRRDYEVKLQEQRSRIQSELAHRVRNRLLSLVKRRSPENGQGEGDGT